MSRFFRWIFSPFRWAVYLERAQMRNLFSVFMLLGIMATSITNWAYMGFAYVAISNGASLAWVGLIIEQTRFNSGLIAWFAFIMGAIVFGADFLRAKFGDKELSMGKGVDDGTS